MQFYVYVKGNDIMQVELQNAVHKLNKLCTSTQIVRECGIAGGDIIDKVHMYTLSVRQWHVKNTLTLRVIWVFHFGYLLTCKTPIIIF